MNFKIVSFGDIHENLKYLDRLAKEIKNSNLVILTGDITNKGGVKRAEQVINRIKELKIDVYAVSGNLDLPEVEDYLDSIDIGLNSKARFFKGIVLTGVGGSNPTHLFTPNEKDEDCIWQSLMKGYLRLNNVRPWILVSHPPPKGTRLDKIFTGCHVGSKAVRDFIVEFMPDVCLCGHIHESYGVDKLGETVIANAGAFGNGQFINLSIKEGKYDVDLMTMR